MSQSNPMLGRAVAALLVVGAIGAGGYYLMTSRGSDPVISTTLPAPGTSEPVAPAVQHPILPPAATTEPQLPPLPELQDSDAEARAALLSLLAEPSLESFIKPEFLIPRVVATIDNLPRERLNAHALPVQRVPGVFVIRGTDHQVFVAEANAERYAPYVRALEAADFTQWAATYQRWYPLFQRAYVELGDPDVYFNDRLIEVIDHLLAAPEVPAQIALVKPKSSWEYADPDLQAASIGHRLMFRLGPDQATRVKARLVVLRAAIIALGAQPAAS